jgi:hypothetical protein
MRKKILFAIPVFMMFWVSPLQYIFAKDLSISRVDGSIPQNMADFHVCSFPTPYRDSLEASDNAVFSNIIGVSVKLYSGRVDDARYIDRSPRILKPVQYFLEIAKKNSSVLFKIENVLRIRDIKRIESVGLLYPIRLQASVVESPFDGKQTLAGENSVLYQIGLRFKDDIESVDVDVAKIPQIPPQIPEIRSVSRYGYRWGRAMLHTRYEAPAYLTVELLNDPGPGTTPVTVAAQQRIDVSSNKLTYDEYRKLSGEASYGCSPQNVEWDGLTLKYEIHVGEKRFRCKLDRLNLYNFDTSCESY